MINVISLPKKMFVTGVLLNIFVRSPSITAFISYIQYIDRPCVFCLMITGRIVIISIAVYNYCEIMFISLFYCLYAHLLKPPKQQHCAGITQPQQTFRRNYTTHALYFCKASLTTHGQSRFMPMTTVAISIVFLRFSS